MDRTAPELHRRLIDQLYVEAMLLADDARGYFDRECSDERASLDPLQRVLFACESLKVTTRLMHVVAWLLTQRAVDAGELRPRDALDPSRRLGDQPESDAAGVEKLPPLARALVDASIDLHRRVALIDNANAEARPRANPVASLQARLAYAF